MTKPDIILLLEKELNYTAEKVDFDKIGESQEKESIRYATDINNVVIGLFIERFQNLSRLLPQIAKQTSLQYLRITGAKLTDISPIKELKNLTSINFMGNQISDISPIKELINLTRIGFGNNKITDISPLKKLNNLITINFDFNQITDITPIKELKNLIIIVFSYNQIADISPIKELKNLIMIDFSHNNQISDISSIKELKNLIMIDFTINQITDISPVKELTNLTEICFEINQITDISPVKELLNLTSINFLGNQITDISPIKELKNLTSINLGHNQITDISPLKELINLKRVSLIKNPIKFLPVWICDFPNMDIQWSSNWINGFIYFEDNPIENVPIEIIKQGKEAIKNWFQQQEKYGKETVYEAKVLIVGEPKAGKTTLLNKLQNPDTKIPDIDQSSTLGITVKHNYKFQHPTLPDVQITANIWDFGGQEIQYMLHQYFLSRDALYVVVSDGRANTTRFEYWFQMIEMLGTTSSRILVMLNRFKDSTGVNPFARFQYKRDFPELTIEDAELDLSETGAQWWEFKKLIAENISKLHIVGQENIKVWNAIRGKIEEINEPYISTREFYKLSHNEGLELDSEVAQILDYFNKIGVVIYFADDPFLANTVFLNPNWITQAIYMVLSNKNIDYQTGKFNRPWLFEFWQSQGYKSYECNDLLNLMQKDKFDICYQLPNNSDNYMVPSILRTDMPLGAFEYKNMLQLRYIYEGFMPFGIMSRLIVRLHKYINEQLVWQRGAILSYENNTKAEIVEPFGKREIQIRIIGKQLKEFRAIIKSELDLIVEQFPNKPTVNIPCICKECSISDEPNFYEYNELQKRRERKKETIECSKSYEDVNVIELLNGIDFTNFRRLLLDENFDEFFKLMKAKFAGISFQTQKKKLSEGDYQREFHLILKENGVETTEVEHGTSEGRIDNLVKIGSRAFIFEHKLDKTAEIALNQIIEKNYQQQFEFEYSKVFLIGVNFSSKTRNIEKYKIK